MGALLLVSPVHMATDKLILATFSTQAHSVIDIYIYISKEYLNNEIAQDLEELCQN